MTNLDVLRNGSAEQIANLFLVDGKNDVNEVYDFLGIDCDGHCPYSKICTEIFSSEEGGKLPCDDDKEIRKEAFALTIKAFLYQEYEPR